MTSEATNLEGCVARTVAGLIFDPAVEHDLAAQHRNAAKRIERIGRQMLVVASRVERHAGLRGPLCNDCLQRSVIPVGEDGPAKQCGLCVNCGRNLEL